VAVDVAIPMHVQPHALVTPHGPRSTLDVLDRLRSIGAQPHLVARVLAPFPIAGPAHYTDDWGLPRHGPPPHAHEGCDIFAERGTPVIATMDGVVGRMTTTSPLGGTSLRLTTPSGTYFYYAHLDRFAPLLVAGSQVRAGDVVGFVGNTGNAATTVPHLHFEIHPRGGAAVPPVPYLDRWLAEARATAGAITGSPALDAVLAPASSDDDIASAGSLPSNAARPRTVRRLETVPVGSIDPAPLVVLAGVVVALWLLAQRSKRHARRRIGARR
jgi:murein DD-endopeptidase MepM/ murein hydrolase activator NlpD